MIRTALAIALAFAVTQTVVAADQVSGNEALDIDKVNGSINVPDNATAGKLTTVNGGIHIGAEAHVKAAETVNGGIDVGRGSTVVSLETVNGGIRMGDKVQVAKTVEAVNGSISVSAGGDVAGKVSNVNGSIHIESGHVGGGLETSSGDIEIGANSRVEGGIVVNEDHSWFHMGSTRKPRIIIGPHASVDGTLAFKRDVELYVSESATIGKVEGASAVKFSGERPDH